MEREEKNHRVGKPPEPEFLFQWGKRLRCVRIKNPNVSAKSNGGIRRRVTTRIVPGSEPSRAQLTNGSARGSDASTVVTALADSKKSPPTASSPEKEERYYTTRGSVHHQQGGSCGGNENGKTNGVEGIKGVASDEKGRAAAAAVWPKIYITLSSKEKEEDFLAMKGCKPPQRPKKRAKMIQRTLLLVSPGAWLTDMCQERYEVREKKTSSRKRPRGLKAMGSMDSDSE